LIEAGADATTPVVIVENGTLPDERAIATTLGDISDCLVERAVNGPAVIFVGLDWADAGLKRPEAIETYARPRSRKLFPNSQI
ncbi:hypothetical protein ABTB76_19695, partial [Acinetobacter baumannii]